MGHEGAVSTGMKISVTEVNPARRSIAVEVPAEEVTAEFDRACLKYSRTLRVPGFRAGKVPLHIVKQRFGREIHQETVERVIEETLERAVKQERLEPLQAPVLKEYSHEPGQPLSFTAEFDVRPAVEVKGRQEIKVMVKQPAVTEAMLTEALDSLRERAARFDPVPDRGLAPGDHALMNVQVIYGAGEGESSKHEDLMIEIGSGGPHPELSEHLRDARPGDIRKFTVDYPAGHENRSLAGKRVDYTIEIKEIKNKVLPDLDDEFARDLGKFESLEELRTRVTEDLRARELRRAKEEARSEALDQLLERNPDVTVPDVLVDDEVTRRVEEMARTMALQGIDPRDASIDWDVIRERHREPATKSVRAMILLDAIAEGEKITHDTDALERAVSIEAVRRKQTPEAVRAKLAKEGRLETLEKQLRRERVLDMLITASNT